MREQTKQQEYWELLLSLPAARTRTQMTSQRAKYIEAWLRHCEMAIPAWYFAPDESTQWDNRRNK